MSETWKIEYEHERWTVIGHPWCEEEKGEMSFRTNSKEHAEWLQELLIAVDNHCGPL